MTSYTQLSNHFIDSEMRTLSASAVCIYLCICRRTTGWHKSADVIAVSQFMDMTGMSKPTVIRSLRELAERGIISINDHQQTRSFSVSATLTLNRDCCGTTNQQEMDFGQISLPVTGQKSLPEPVKNFDPQKKEKIKSKKKEVQRDSRLSQWQFTVYRELTRLHVPHAFRDEVAQLTDERIWRDVITKWIGRGYRPNGISGMLDWYKKEEANVRRTARQSDGRSNTSIQDYLTANEHFIDGI